MATHLLEMRQKARAARLDENNVRSKSFFAGGFKSGPLVTSPIRIAGCNAFHPLHTEHV
jgi:hypothetical protein